MKHLIITFALLAAFAASADKIVTRTAPDGVNTLTTHVDDNGYVASEQSTLVNVCEKFHDQEAEDDATRQLIQESLAKIAEAHREEVEAGEIVQSVYGEGSNSSFIVKKELTATQKRFLALGRQYMRMAYFANALAFRVSELEKKLDEVDRRTAKDVLTVASCQPDAGASSNLQARVEALEEREAKRQAEIDARRKASETARAKRKAADDKASADKVQRAIDRAQGGKTAKSRREVR